MSAFAKRLSALRNAHAELTESPNAPYGLSNGVFQRWRDPILTAAHVPLSWRYDLNEKTNPFLMERLGVNAVFNAGAIFRDGKHVLVARVEGADRKSFFAVAESASGVDGFRFWDRPLEIPETDTPDGNIYDMRLTVHEDGWIYGIFCTERKDARSTDTTAAIAQCGIARTKDLRAWERLPDLVTPSAQQRNVVLHPELIDGKYAFYTRPQDGFVDVGGGGGLGWGSPTTSAMRALSANHRRSARVPHDQGSQERPRPATAEDGARLAAPGARRAQHGRRAALRALRFHDLDREAVGDHLCAGRLSDGAGSG